MSNQLPDESWQAVVNSEAKAYHAGHPRDSVFGAFVAGARSERNRQAVRDTPIIGVSQWKEQMSAAQRGNIRIDPSKFTTLEEHVAYLELTVEALSRAVQPAINCNPQRGL
jgi:hypothetical protein